MNNFLTGCLYKLLGILALYFVYVLIFAWIVSLIWNFVMPDIFGLPEINYIQALLLMILLRLILPNISISQNKDK